MIGRTLGIGTALVLSLGSGAWADEAVRPADFVAALSQGQDKDDDSACAQRRGRRPRRAESSEAANPYEGQEGVRGQAGEPAPNQSAVSGSDDPRTAAEGSGGGSPGGGGEAAGGDAAAGGLQRSDHLDFDDRLIQGQTARAGAVYLFSRPPRDLPELVKLRRSFRAEISRTVLARDPIAPAAAPAPPAPATTGRGAAARTGNGSRPPEAGTTPPPAEGTEGREGREGRGGRRGGRR